MGQITLQVNSDPSMSGLFQGLAWVGGRPKGTVACGLVFVFTINNKVITGFQAVRQARAPVAGLEPATEGSLQISGRIGYSGFWSPKNDLRQGILAEIRVNGHTDQS
ncbi:hypothetical protein PoB_003265600 [Plakobranchus ocellatus]|uniref:Dirigent protein n=1 Tax=Plakobranchus ocellatus TaxID=259542 RepID=A0AAV4AHR2_9GAST|nr:hypothetical protein PoB_003265600 [Plakobranchus ocellatus]